MKTVILAAGFGSRLWPLSTSEKPKQFQPLINGETLLQYTYSLMRKIVQTDELYVLTLKGLEHHVFDELPEIATENVLIVPERRNTLPHTLWAINAIGSENPDEPILFKSADQYMTDPEAFLTSLHTSVSRIADLQPLKDLVLVVMESDYGPNYGFAVIDEQGRIVTFVEKPSEEVYRQLAKQGKPYRSPFIYVTSKNVMLRMLSQLQASVAKQAVQLLQCPDAERIPTFLAMPVIDISSGLFQAGIAMRGEVIDCEFVDVGRFATLYDVGKKDALGNVVQGKVVLGEDCRNNFIVNQLQKPLVVTDIQHMVVVQTAAGSVVAPIQSIDAVGEIYKQQIYKRSASE